MLHVITVSRIRALLWTESRRNIFAQRVEATLDRLGYAWPSIEPMALFEGIRPRIMFERTVVKGGLDWPAGTRSGLRHAPICIGEFRSSFEKYSSSVDEETVL